jgi:hypothetical protein
MTHADWRCRARRPLVNLTGVVGLGNGPDRQDVATTAASFSRSGRGRGYAGYRADRPAHGRGGARGKSLRPVARVRSRLLLPLARTRAFSPPARARAGTCRAAPRNPPGLTTETTCVPRDRDAQRAARSARRARAPEAVAITRKRGRSRRGGCCRCSSVATACQEPQGTLAFVGQRELWVCR